MRNLVDDFLVYLRHERGQSEQTQKTYAALLLNFVAWAEGQRQSLGYEIDGVVIKVNQTALQRRLGDDAPHEAKGVHGHPLILGRGEIVGLDRGRREGRGGYYWHRASGTG